MQVLFIGDIVGSAGRRAVREVLPHITKDHCIDLTIANGENAAGGFGITPLIARELIECSVDVLTSGNHIWDRKDIIGFLESEDVLLRPANYPKGVPGKGSVLVTTRAGISVGVINLSGRVFMESIDCPFTVALQETERLRKYTPVIIVDMHAEATAEKEAMGWFLDGRVSAVVGTHTHVQTADERILPRGTAYITDVGMAGSLDSVIGIKKEIAIDRFLTQMPRRFEIAKSDAHLQGVIFAIDEESGRSTEIRRVSIPA
jgi:2',3'-cyclic-nucleotide 2'-phosphodiesterase